MFRIFARCQIKPKFLKNSPICRNRKTFQRKNPHSCERFRRNFVNFRTFSTETTLNMQIKSPKPTNQAEFAAAAEVSGRNAEENFQFVMNALKQRQNRKVSSELSKRNLIDALKFAASAFQAVEESANSALSEKSAISAASCEKFENSSPSFIAEESIHAEEFAHAEVAVVRRAKEFAAEFLLIFDRWLDCVNDRLTEMKAEDVYHLIVNFGRINTSTAELPLPPMRHYGGGRRRIEEKPTCDLRRNSLTRWHIQSLESQFVIDSRDLQSPGMYSQLMLGFRQLYWPQDYYSPGGYPTYQVIAKMLRYFHEIHNKKQKNLHNFFQVSESLADSCFYLSEMKQLLDRSGVDFYLTFFKDVFENFDPSMPLVDEQPIAGQSPMSPESKYLRLLNFFDRTGRTFLNWQLNPDLFTNGLWSAWFKSVTSLLSDPELEKLSPSNVKDPGLLADTVVTLCATCFTISDQFDQIQYTLDVDSQDLFNRHLTLWIRYASLNVCNRLHESVQSCQAYIKAKAIVVAINQDISFVPDDCQLLKNPDLIDIITEKVGEYEQSKATTNSGAKRENEEFRTSDSMDRDDQSESTSGLANDFDQSESRFRSRPASSSSPFTSSSANSNSTRRRRPVERLRHQVDHDDDWKREKF